ncbi:hypothetical protein CMQ_7342 [Grosmannia clavigera kw1407]|uniref:Linalool dehydratase/isomerase domain-containing protein n=1 Tax=Grosmannia clavigera (strain kw1407 / UAMH 11150) TaxID=655863 RepID=F0XNL7_GROCL|nr:uncharacterized protein CMQ_7342 [Grosmannia clavigera kw1407]EFX00340.1 hypothetical protein CMQ_7342 [Grosmannia clavigera kw1407]
MLAQWFGAGALSVPLLLWAGSIPGAYLATGDRIWPKAGVVAAALLLVLFLYANRTAAASRRHGIEQRTARNAMIESSLGDIDARFTAASSRGGGRELDLATLRHLQHSFDMALQPPSDWSWFTRIDQFQTSALRYQVYEIMYALGTYQGIYTPNAHAYVSEAFRRIIARSLTPDVLGFWKWESLLGRFSADFDPVLHDNIMVTGFLLQGLMLYTANTGDERYCRKNSVRFQVTSDRTYAYDLHSIRDSVLHQWQASPFCLFACEPNWIYTPCNFQGLTGSRLYDRYFGSSGTDVLMPVFEESLCRNFSETNGSILPIRSELTGFTIPGLCGALGDLTVVMFARGTINHLSRRFWAIFLGEKVVFDRETGQLSLTGLVGADKMDAGNYTPSDYAIYPHLAQAAGEYGDKDLRAAALKKCYDGFGQITTPTGATCLDPAKASTATNLSVLRAELMQGGDWRDLITKGPPPTALSGPILSHAPYPGVLIAKAYSNDSVDLDMVLYPSGDSGTFSLTVSRLQPGKTYSFPTETTVADEMGDATFSVLVNGRTHVHLVLTDAEDTE